MDEAQRALLQYAAKVTQEAWNTGAEDTQRLREHGWNDAQIAEAVYVIALFNFFNRVADAFGVPPMGYLAANKLTP